MTKKKIGYKSDSFYLPLWCQLVTAGNEKVDYPAPPYALIIEAREKLKVEDWNKVIRQAIDSGAEWFCGVGKDGGLLESYWGSNDMETDKDREVATSIDTPTLEEAIESLFLMGVGRGDNELKSGLILTDDAERYRELTTRPLNEIVDMASLEE